MRHKGIILAAAIAVALAAPALAYHDGGVAECSGCHSMHTPVSTSFLLVGANQSETCLSCHESEGDTGPRSYHISTHQNDMTPGSAPLQRSPGGDFAWVRMDRTVVVRGNPVVFEGQENGHNIVAPNSGYVADTNNTIAPGGTMSAGNLSCVSCHDPHGRGRIVGTAAAPVVQVPAIGTTYAPIFGSGSYDDSDDPSATEAIGTYRLLPGNYYTPLGAGTAFAGVPVGVAPHRSPGYNASEAATTIRVAYGHGTANGFTTWGRWCGNCHGDFSALTGGHKHKTEEGLGSTVSANYEAYVQTGNWSGNWGTAGNPRVGPYTSLVPFAEFTTDLTTLRAHATDDETYMNGPDNGDEVMTCFSCHRAHASAWKHGLRWNPDSEFLTFGSAGAPVYPDANGDSAGYTMAQVQAAYYDRAPDKEFSAHQRSLCNKCHLKD